MRLNDFWPVDWVLNTWPLLAFSIFVGVCFSLLLGVPLIKVSAFEGRAQLRLAYWVLLVACSTFFVNIVFEVGAPRTVPIMEGFLLFVFAVGARFLALTALRYSLSKEFNGPLKRVAVYGAGNAGMQLVELLKSDHQYDVVTIFDGNKNLDGVMMSGVGVASPSKMKKLIAKKKIETIYLAIPSVSAERKRELRLEILSTGCEVKEMPSYTELLASDDILTSLQPVTPDSLLGRDGVEIDLPEINQAYAGKNVLVSGAGGSIGSELARKIIGIGSKSLVLYELSELALYQIEKELKPLAEEKGIKLYPVLGSVRDSVRINDILKRYSVEVVLHAAAYKHVPLIEMNELEAGRNNILGTKTIAEAALKNKIERFILISTDKAVRPTNVMGASKRFAELVVQDLDVKSKNTIFSIVRFGNVLGSSGSVIPLFKEQIEAGGPLTVTDAEVTRYFMTISEAAKLVLLAGSYAEGGDVFVLDMGEPVKIIDLAKKMIEFSGFKVLDDKNPQGDIEIKVTGLRPGEKLYEELLIGDNTLPTPHEKILRAQEVSLSSAKLNAAVKKIDKEIANNNDEGIRKVLLEVVEGFIPAAH
ncbi:MAG: polysaccharide biosynthesis protein [Nitratireductor sp.]